MATLEIAYLVPKTGVSGLKIVKVEVLHVMSSISTPGSYKIHAIFRKYKGVGWTVFDYNSNNGVFVNLKKIEANVPFCLKEGDDVNLGKNSMNKWLSYVFHSSLEATEPRTDVRKRKKSSEESVDASYDALVQLSKQTEVLQLRQVQRRNDTFQRPMQEERIRQDLELKYQKDMQAMENNYRDRLAYQDAVIISLQTNLEETSNRLNKIVLDKETERSFLERRLEEVKVSNEKNQAAALKAHAEAWSEVGKFMEEKLKCNVCLEFLIQTTTLNCAHNFCRYCIIELMKRDPTNAKCPICRVKINCVLPSVVIDSLIDDIIEELPPEKKAEMKAIVDERIAKSANQTDPSTVAEMFTQGRVNTDVNSETAPSLSSTNSDTLDPISDDDSNAGSGGSRLRQWFGPYQDSEDL